MEEICRPKCQGGLGLKPIRLVNEALMIKHLWNILSEKESLWVKWVNTYRLKGGCVWNLVVPNSTSWSWKQIMKLRDKICDYVGFKIGNGRGCFIWFDRWHSNGPLSKLISHNLLASYGIDVKDKVADWIDNNNWKCSDWYRRFDSVIDVPVPNLNEFNDKAVWFNKKNEVMNFSVKEVCNVIRRDVPDVLWYKHV